jgi:NADPH-dependent F420 reductase
VKVAIVGGTGPFGRGLAARLAAAGDEVVIGSRDAERARSVASELGVEGATNTDSVRGADLVVLAVKADAAVDTARELGGALGRTPLLCVASELVFGKDGVRPEPGALSVAAKVAAAVEAPIASGLHSLAASTLAGGEPPDEDALVCGDDADAKALALELAGKVVAGRALDAGPLDSARALEGMTAVIVNLNRRYKGHAGIRITGLP